MIFAGNYAVKSAGLYYTGTVNDNLAASTTATFIIGGNATTTKTFNSDGYEQVSYLVALGSSTTPPTLSWKNQYSNNGVDWYNEDQVFASSTTHLSTDRTETWVYSTTTAGTNIISRGTNGVTLFVGRKIVVPNLDTVYTRTQFSISPTSHAMLDVREVKKNTVVTNK